MDEKNDQGPETDPERHFLTAEEILEKDDIVIQPLLVPEWGENSWVYVKSMTGTQRDKFEGSLVKMRERGMKVSSENFRAKLIAKVLCDAKGKPLFSQAHVENLGRKNSAAISRIYNLASRLSLVSDEDVDELVGN